MQIGTWVALNHLVHVLETRLVLLRTLIDDDTTQNDIATILWNLSSKSQGSEGGEGRKGGRKEKEGKKKNAKKGNKSNIELKLSNFRYYKNFFETSVTSCR